MSKLVAIFVLVAAFAFAADSAVKGLGNRIECFDVKRFQTRIYENKIKEAIKNLMEKLKNEGIPSMNISSVDPFVLDNLHIGMDNQLAKLNWNMTEGQIVGITNLELPKVSFNIAGMKFAFGFNWPSIHGQGKYQLDGILGGVLPLYGSGDFDVEGINAYVEVNGKLGTDENKFLHINNFTISIALEKFNALFTGLMDDPKLSEIISQMATESVPALLVEFKDTITEVLSPKLAEIGNKFLENKTINDIIGGLGKSADWINCGGYITKLY